MSIVDMRIVTPDNMGDTLKLGVVTEGKYDVNVEGLTLPDPVADFRIDQSQGKKELVLQTTGGEKRLDITPLLPPVAVDIALKSGRYDQGSKSFVFTVGQAGNTNSDSTVIVPASDLLPVSSDGTTITGSGTEQSKLAVRVSSTSGNLLKSDATGLSVATADIQRVANEAVAAGAPEFDVRFVDASGRTVLGYGRSRS